MFPKIGVPQNGWFISWKTLLNIGWFGGFSPRLFLVQHPYSDAGKRTTAKQLSWWRPQFPLPNRRPNLVDVDLSMFALIVCWWFWNPGSTHQLREVGSFLSTMTGFGFVKTIPGGLVGGLGFQASTVGLGDFFCQIHGLLSRRTDSPLLWGEKAAKLMKSYQVGLLWSTKWVNTSYDGMQKFMGMLSTPPPKRGPPQEQGVNSRPY